MSGMRFLTDPILRDRVGPLVRIAAPLDVEAAADVDAVLLSHLHADHAQPSSLRNITPPGGVLAPHGAAAWLRRRGIPNVRELRAGEEAEVGSVRVEAVPATHGSRRSR